MKAVVSSVADDLRTIRLCRVFLEVNDASPDDAVAAELHDRDSTAMWDQDDAGDDAAEVVADITQAAPELAWSAGNP